MRPLLANAKQHLFWATAGFALGIWTIQSDRRIEDLKRQVKELDLDD